MGVTCPGQGYEIKDAVCEHRQKTGYYEGCLTCKRRVRMEAQTVQDKIKQFAEALKKKREKESKDGVQS